MRFETHSGTFFIKANLIPEFTCLSFPDEFHRARKNSIDLFQILIGQRVLSVRQFENERSFALILTNDLTFVFKMHGNRSNLVLFEKERIRELFKNNIRADNNLALASFDKTVDWGFANFEAHRDNPAKAYFTFGKLVWEHLREKGFHIQSAQQQWRMILDVRDALEQKHFFIVDTQKGPALTMLKVEKVIKSLDTPIAALNEFYYTYTQVFTLFKEKNALLTSLNSKLQSGKNYYKKTFAKLAELEQDTSYKVWADLIMANLHQLKAGDEKAVVNNFYNNDHLIEIKLKRELSPQKTAELYYRKSKNQQIEAEHLQNALFAKEKQIAETENLIESIQQVNDLKTLRKLKSEISASLPDDNDSENLPYHEFIFQGFKIWVGKNAQSNDTLTQRFGYKEDLWLHAKDVPGSHVLLKYQAGKNFPKPVIERAAELAAYNSKRKNETLCPVIVTPRKFVRKRKGDPAGTVVVEREDVIMVEPRLGH
jgi:predicted ribosome quality control (RQC) complex YloA/Tae2 family protein